VAEIRLLNSRWKIRKLPCAHCDLWSVGPALKIKGHDNARVIQGAVPMYLGIKKMLEANSMGSEFASALLELEELIVLMDGWGM
jgi:hypothetical protein